MIGFLPVSVSEYDVDEEDLVYDMNSIDKAESSAIVTLDDDIVLIL